MKRIAPNEVPSISRKGYDWNKLFTKVPSDAYLQIEDKDEIPTGIGSALNKLKANGQFTDVFVAIRTVNGNQNTYLYRKTVKEESK